MPTGVYKHKNQGKNNPRWIDGRKCNNPERYRQEYMKDYRPKWRAANKERDNFHSRTRRARRKNAEGFFTFDEWKLLKRQYGYTCLMCGKKEPEIKLTIDHIIPLIKGGSNYIENIQPLCQSCNSKKYLKIIDFTKVVRSKPHLKNR